MVNLSEEIQAVLDFIPDNFTEDGKIERLMEWRKRACCLEESIYAAQIKNRKLNHEIKKLKGQIKK